MPMLIATVSTTGPVIPWWAVMLAGVLLVGAGLAGILGRGRIRRRVDGLVAQRTGELEAQLATARQRIGELEQARAAAETRSRIDPLTGLFTRSHLTEQMLGELERADATRQPGLVLVDLVGLRDVNHTYGHLGGDTLLREVAGRLHGTLRGYDCIARWDASRFALLMPQVPDDAALWRVAESLRRVVVSAPVPIGPGQDVWARCAVGCAHASELLWNLDRVVDAAEAAVSWARTTGADRAVLHGAIATDLTEPPDALRIAEGIARTAALREGMPEEHCPQVADLAAATAVQLGLDDAHIMRCRLAGWLHDVGKIAIPEDTLRKPTPLDDTEWDVMRTHSVLGEQLLAAMPNLADVAPIVRHHHERFDGTGYPDGLAGRDIPIEARIVAAADTYAAITSAPAFRPPRDPAQALTEVRASAGTQLDPEVTEALCTIITARLAAHATVFASLPPIA